MNEKKDRLAFFIPPPSSFKNYEKSLELNPANANGAEMLKRLRNKQ